MTLSHPHTAAWERQHRLLSFDQTVARQLAHRYALGEVLLADSARVDDETFLLGFQLPRSHRLWSDRRGALHDPLVTVEAGRQGLFVLLHRYFDVPFGLPMVLREIGFQVLDVAAFADDGRSGRDAVLSVRLTDRQYRGGALVGMAFAGELQVEGIPAATMRGDIMTLRSEDYEVLRAMARARKPLADVPAAPAATPVDPALVGRYVPGNVVIADTGTPDRFRVLVDQGHPSFFDHPLDHVPGPLLLEAFRQAATAGARRAGRLTGDPVVPAELQVAFIDYGELEGAVDCTVSLGDAGPDGGIPAELAAHQFGAQIASARLTLR